MEMTGPCMGHFKDSVYRNWQVSGHERQEKGRKGYYKQVRGINIQLHPHPFPCFLYLPKMKAVFLELCLYHLDDVRGNIAMFILYLINHGIIGR